VHHGVREYLLYGARLMADINQSVSTEEKNQLHHAIASIKVLETMTSADFFEANFTKMLEMYAKKEIAQRFLNFDLEYKSQVITM